MSVTNNSSCITCYVNPATTSDGLYCSLLCKRAWKAWENMTDRQREQIELAACHFVRECLVAHQKRDNDAPMSAETHVVSGMLRLYSALDPILNLASVENQSIWTISSALPVINRLQPAAIRAGFHLALAGGVLSKGSSEHDLDVVAVPLQKDKKSIHCEEHLVSALSDELNFIAVRTSWDIGRCYQFDLDGKRIDVLVYDFPARQEPNK